MPICGCDAALTGEDGLYAISVTPYDGELVAGEPTGDPGIGLSTFFSIETPPLEVSHIEVYNTDRPPGDQLVKVLEEGDVLTREEVGSCPAFHTVTTGSRDNSWPESLEGTFSYPSGTAAWNETNQPYCWEADYGWYDSGSGIPVCGCDGALTSEDGAYSITVTPYDGELDGGEPTGNPGEGLTVVFYVPEPSLQLLLAAGIGLLAGLYRARGRSI